MIYYDQSYVDFGDNEQLRFGKNDFTAEAWVYWPDGLANSSYCVMSNKKFDNNNTYLSGFQVVVNTNAERLHLILADGGGIWGNGIGNAYCDLHDPGEWYHVVAVRVGNTAGDWKIYINGVSQTTFVVYDNLGSGDISSGTLETFKIGSDKFGRPNNQQYFEGSIRDVRLYNRKLTTSEVQDLYNGGCTPDLNLSGLVFYAPLNEGTGSESYDNTVYGATGSFEGTGLDWGRDLGKFACVDGNKVCFGGGEYREAGYAYGYSSKLRDDDLKGSGNSYDFGARMYDSRLGRWLSVDPLAHLRTWVSPYNFVQNNPINRVDPTGALDNPIYGEDGDFLGTDDKGLQGEAIVMNKDDFKQGMSHEDALDKGTLRSDMPLVTSPKIFDKIDNHFAGLSSRPDYDGFVTIDEGIEWAKQRPNTLGNNDPNDALYLDASKLNFGDLSVDNIGLKQGQQDNVNLFNYVNWTSSSSRATTYALGNTQMKLLNPNAGTVKLFSDIYDWDYHNNPPSGTRDRLIQAERWRSGVNSSHGFRIFMFGTGTIKK